MDKEKLEQLNKFKNYIEDITITSNKINTVKVEKVSICFQTYDYNTIAQVRIDFENNTINNGTSFQLMKNNTDGKMKIINLIDILIGVYKDEVEKDLIVSQEIFDKE